MCGIAGIVGAPGDFRIGAMTKLLHHRGPDGSGDWRHGPIALGATRLAIIDLAAPPQPMVSTISGAAIVFNGEIYNHRALRRELEQQGVRFETQTDTEVILRLYEAMGDDCVGRLQGMFAFAVADGDRLLIARDRVGIKPLYYAWVPEVRQFIFASEAKALLQHPGIHPSLDLQAFAGSLLIGYPTDVATFFEGIRSLQPGHTLVVYSGDPIAVGEPRAYYWREAVVDEEMTLEAAEECLATELGRAVESHLAADVEVALTLSGGIDSTLLALFAAEQVKGPLRTFTVGDHETYADVVQAGRVAHMIGSRHQTVVLGFNDYLAAIPSLVEAEERPSSLHALPFHILCRRIAVEVKACMHGEGADELFGGYGEYLNREPRLSYIRRRLPVLRHLGVSPSEGVLATIERLSAPETFQAYLPNVFAVNLGDALERQHLMPVDKLAMAAGLEMRVPYLDDRMLALMARMPLPFLVRSDIGVQKYLLRRLALKRFGMPLLDVVLREKLGAPAAGIVLLDRFDRLCNETLPDSYIERHPFGPCFTAKRELLMFDFFSEVFITHRGDSGAVGPISEFIAARAGRRLDLTI